MSPTLIALLLPLLQGLVAIIAGPAESWLIEHAITYLAGHIIRKVRLGTDWSLQAAVSDQTKGIVTVQVTRGGQSAVVLVLYPLQMTASHQDSLAAVFGVLFHEGEQYLLAAFAKVAPRGALSTTAGAFLPAGAGSLTVAPKAG